MFCSNCGTRMSDDAVFCPECGTLVKRGNGGNAQQTVNQNMDQTPAQSQKEIPAAGTKQAKIIITITGLLAFVSLFLDAVGTSSIYDRLKMIHAEKIFGFLCISVLLVIVLNLLNLQKWSLIGSFGMFVFLLEQSIEMFRLRKISGGAVSPGIGFWLFLAAAILCLAVSVREAVLSFFEKYKGTAPNAGPSPVPSQSYTQYQAHEPAAQKSGKGLKIGGIVMIKKSSHGNRRKR